jgi:tetratricopeptide (TPR) repeat protein
LYAKVLHILDEDSNKVQSLIAEELNKNPENMDAKEFLLNYSLLSDLKAERSQATASANYTLAESLLDQILYVTNRKGIDGVSSLRHLAYAQLQVHDHFFNLQMNDPFAALRSLKEAYSTLQDIFFKYGHCKTINETGRSNTYFSIFSLQGFAYMDIGSPDRTVERFLKALQIKEDPHIRALLRRAESTVPQTREPFVMPARQEQNTASVMRDRARQAVFNRYLSYVDKFKRSHNFKDMEVALQCAKNIARFTPNLAPYLIDLDRQV